MAWLRLPVAGLVVLAASAAAPASFTVHSARVPPHAGSRRTGASSAVRSRGDDPPSEPASGYCGFPRDLLAVLRCPMDGEELSLRDSRGGVTHVREGALACGRCAHVVPIEAGIVRMLATEALDAEERHEVALRDAQTRALAREREHAYWSRPYSRRETASTLRALRPDGAGAALDLGCGTGRYTTELARACRHVLAVDFSLESLGWLARESAPPPNVGLLHGDITRLRLAPRRFERVLATTPLDSRAQRLAMHRVAADALGDSGIYVFSVEHYDARSRWRRAPRAQRYRPGENLFFRLRRHEVEREAAPFFLDVRGRPINVALPLSRALPAAWRPAVAGLAERIPGLRELGELVLVRAARPLREPEEGAPAESAGLLRLVQRLARTARGD